GSTRGRRGQASDSPNQLLLLSAAVGMCGAHAADFPNHPGTQAAPGCMPARRAWAYRVLTPQLCAQMSAAPPDAQSAAGACRQPINSINGPAPASRAGGLRAHAEASCDVRRWNDRCRLAASASLTQLSTPVHACPRHRCVLISSTATLMARPRLSCKAA